jgi:hypothetical protein
MGKFICNLKHSTLLHCYQTLVDPKHKENYKSSTCHLRPSVTTSTPCILSLRSMYVCIYIYIYIYTHTHTHTHTYKAALPGPLVVVYYYRLLNLVYSRSGYSESMNSAYPGLRFWPACCIVAYIWIQCWKIEAKKDILDNDQVTHESGKCMNVMSIAGDQPSRCIGSWIFQKDMGH